MRHVMAHPQATVRFFNNESIEEYLGRSYKIVTGEASAKNLPVKPLKLFVHFCLSHIMHAFSRYLKKFFTEKKKEIYNVLLQRSYKFRKRGNFP